jgi:predicted nucleic acid-binding protein
MLTPGEPVAGFEIGRRREQNRAKLQEIRQAGRVRLAEITEETAERYARIYTHLRGNERPIPTNDLWIAAQR